MLFLHIGTHKTGTSALQTFMARGREALRAQGVHYLQAGLGSGIAHHALSWSIRGRNDKDMSVWEKVRAELAANRGATQVISSEALWFTEAARVRAELGDESDVRIVIYLRRQDQYLQSLYKQAITSGRKHDFNAWHVEYGLNRGDYVAVVRQWADAFGRDSIVVRPYEQNGVRIDAAVDFCEVLGIDGSEALAQRLRPDQNPSPRRELLELFRAANRVGVDFPHDKFFWSVIGRSPSYVRSGDVLSYAQCVELMKAYDVGNRALSEEFYRDSASPLFPALVPFELPPMWGWDHEEYQKMNIAFLEGLIEIALSGAMTLKPGLAARLKKKQKQLKAGAEAD